MAPGCTPSETELRVARAYAEVLELDQVHVEDDLFTLGGDSLQAVRIALALERAFGIGLPLEVMEQSTRVDDVAAWIDARLTQPHTA